MLGITKIQIQYSWIQKRLLRYNQNCDEKLPLVKIRKNKPQIEISLSQLLISRDIQIYLSIYMFLWIENAMKLVKIPLRITKDVKIQDGRQLWLKKSFSVLGKRRDTQNMKFSSHPYTHSLQSPSYSNFSQVSHEPSCSHELWCRESASCFWNKYVLFFLSNALLYTHILRYTAAAGTECYKPM